MPNEIKVTVGAKGDGGLGKIRDNAKRAGKDISDDLDRGFKDAERSGTRASKSIGDDLERVERSGKEAGKEVDLWISKGMTDAARSSSAATGRISADLEQVGDEAAGAGARLKESLAEGFESIAGGGGLDLGGMLGGITGKGGAALGAGVAIGGTLVAGIVQGVQEVWSRNELAGVISAQQGGTVAEAQKIGEAAGEAFSDGFGDNIDDVGAAVSAVLGNSLTDLDAPAEELERLAELAATASKVVGEEANSIARAAKQLLVNGLADNAQHAIDIIVSASQAGLNVSGDLIDTIVEYSTQFRALGLDGPQALGLISQAMQAGSRDTDFAADALKEFAARAVDGSETTARGFRALGLDAAKMGTAIAQGGATANDALDVTLDRLRAIEDPLLRAQTAVDLFGPKAEDLGAALFAMDLDTVSGQMGNFIGATDEAAATMNATRKPTENLARGFDNLVNSLLSGIPGLNQNAEAIDENIQRMVEWQQFLNTDPGMTFLDKLKEKYPQFAPVVDAYIEQQGLGKEATDESANSVFELVDSLEELISKQREAAGEVLDLSEAHIGYQEAIDAANEALDTNKKNLDLSTEGGRENQSALNDLADSTHDLISAMVTQGATTQEVQGFVTSARQQFINMATAMGMSATDANNLADKLGLIPGEYNANVVVNTGNAMARIQAVIDKLQEFRYLNALPIVGLATGGLALGAAAGNAAGGPTSAAVYGSGLPHAATGGARGSVTWAHEQGPELIQQPNGSVVVPAGLSKMLMQGFAGGWSAPAVIEIRSGGAPLDDLLVEILRKSILNRGGNVQEVLGKAGV